MKIAQYRTNTGNTMISALLLEDVAKVCGWVQLSEPLEVEFVELPASIRVANELAQIDAAEAEVRERFQVQLNSFAERRANLQALTVQS